MATRPPAPSASSQRGERSGSGSIGRYRRLDQIGKGSFATVYKGIHPVKGNLIAIKTVQHAQLKGKLRANLFSEINIMKDIAHPHIVGLVDVLESTNHIHLIMEFCSLGDMATFVKKRHKYGSNPVTSDMLRRYPHPPSGGFNEVIVRHFAKQLASALEFLRAKNLVHRDLKPQNLLLNPPYSWIQQDLPENQPFAVSKESLVPAAGLRSLPCLKIADFGFARHLPTTTMAETLCGSPLYMAPEILRYEKYDAKADLWSVGTVLFELVVGNPPFRAANHVELMRKIERANDELPWPKPPNPPVSVSRDMRVVITALLKKMPADRISWEEFFQSAIVTNDIPGLVEGDWDQIAERHLTASRDRLSPSVGSERRPMAPRRGSNRGSSDRSSLDQPRFSTPPESATAPRRSSMSHNRPILPDRATAPSAVPGVRNDRIPEAAILERRKSTQPPSPGVISPRDTSDRERALQSRQDEGSSRDARERTAQDIAFERDYVMVEKRAVEVNAFADELAASPHVQIRTRQSPSSPAALARRATTQAVPKTGQPSNTDKAMQVALRPESAQQRRASYDRRLTPSKTSAQSALAAALNMVNLRFVNHPFSPALGRNPSPPQGYGPFPAFPAQPTQPLLIGDSPRDKAPVDEDHRVLTTMEDSATRSDVVYGFAEVKYKQLIPIAPSTDNALRGREEPTDDDDGLTPDAIVGISEEALVLYLKALAILTNTINLAGSWWSHKTRNRDGPASDPASYSQSPRTTNDGASSGSSGGKSSGFAAVGSRINGVVQWARNRFNECLEKSEFVSRKLMEAQQKLPSYHEAIRSQSGQPSGDNDQVPEISLRSGITAEKLMYDRALEMSRTAAVNELVHEDLPGCEMSYLTAMRLLEAVLEKDGDEEKESKREGKKPRREREIDENGEEAKRDGDEAPVSVEDRDTVLHMIDQCRGRLRDLRKKLALQKASQKNVAKETDKEKVSSHHRRGSSTSPGNAAAIAMAGHSSSPGSAAKQTGASPR